MIQAVKEFNIVKKEAFREMKEKVMGMCFKAVQQCLKEFDKAERIAFICQNQESLKYIDKKSVDLTFESLTLPQMLKIS